MSKIQLFPRQSITSSYQPPGWSAPLEYEYLLNVEGVCHEVLRQTPEGEWSPWRTAGEVIREPANAGAVCDVLRRAPDPEMGWEWGEAVKAVGTLVRAGCEPVADTHRCLHCGWSCATWSEGKTCSGYELQLT